MIHSMTGFGRAQQDGEDLQITLEMKSVNHRYLDIVIKAPRLLMGLEEQIKSRVKEQISRGRVEIYINYSESGTQGVVVEPNDALISAYADAYREVAVRYNLNQVLEISDFSRLPDAFSVRSLQRTDEELAAVLMPAVDEALERLVSMRRREGETLVRDLRDRIRSLREQLDGLMERAPEISRDYKDKMIERIQELIGPEVRLDEERLITEAAIFADKTNVTEEIVRMRSHFDQFEALLEEDGSVGRKLDFLMQELNREVNTIGSKSPDQSIASLVIEMKSEVEKIREQVQNLE